MNASRFPIWRTNPAGFGASGYWPILTGISAILLVPPLLGMLLSFLSAAIPDPIGSFIEEVSIVLIVSPMFSWVVLLVALPLSHFAARAGFAGWGIAVLLGGVAGMATIAILDGGSVPAEGLLSFAAIGAGFALLYWFAIRLVHPAAIGVTFRQTAP